MELSPGTGGIIGAGNTITTPGGTQITLAAAKNVVFAGAFTTAGGFDITLTTTAATSVTLPTGGTLLSSNGSVPVTANFTVDSGSGIKIILFAGDPTNYYLGRNGTGVALSGAQLSLLSSVGPVNIGATAPLTTDVNLAQLGTMAGPPTGAAQNGCVVLDSVNSKLWARIGGAWKGVALA